MELRKLRFFNTADSRTRALYAASSLVYDLWMVRYSVSRTVNGADNDRFTVALSTREEDRVEDATVIPIDEVASDPQIFGIYHAHYEAPTDVGVSLSQVNSTVTWPKAFTVPWLSVLWDVTWGNSTEMSVEIYFERRRASAEELAHMVLRSGGRARS